MLISVETTDAHIPIVAVFGSNSHQAIAESIGSRIAAHYCILLTGGETSTPAGSPAVKEAAIAGAERASGVWIGVARDDNTLSCTIPTDERSCVIRPQLGHKRNYLEACLCDVAIALENGDGTTSEVTFCLSLGKPVALVGKQWMERYPLDTSALPNTRKKLLEDSFRRVDSDSSTLLNGLLTPEAIRSGLDKSPLLHQHFPAAAAAAPSIARWACEMGCGGKSPGCFPPVHAYEGIRGIYEEWLNRKRSELRAAVRNLPPTVIT